MRRTRKFAFVCLTLAVHCAALSVTGGCDNEPTVTVNYTTGPSGSRPTAETPKTGKVSIEDFEKLRSQPDAVVLDVRTEEEYAAGHVPGAIHLMAGDLPDRLAELPAERPIFAICASGYRSSIAASLLQQAGHRDVSWVSGGVGSWRAAGLPVERS